jgi:hypothetical protein
MIFQYLSDGIIRANIHDEQTDDRIRRWLADWRCSISSTVGRSICGVAGFLTLFLLPGWQVHNILL